MRILCDLDSTFCDSLPAWLDAIYKDSGVRARVEDITRWEMETCPPLDKLRPSEVFKHLETPGFTLGIPPMRGAVEVLQQLHQEGHELLFVTARYGPVAMAETLQWVERYCPLLVARESVIFAAKKHILEADMLIDDRGSLVSKYALLHPQAKVVLVGYPYNEGTERLADNITRIDYGANTWENIHAHILSLNR
jgi:uncharacterized protein